MKIRSPYLPQKHPPTPFPKVESRKRSIFWYFGTFIQLVGLCLVSTNNSHRRGRLTKLLENEEWSYWRWSRSGRIDRLRVHKWKEQYSISGKGGWVFLTNQQGQSQWTSFTGLSRRIQPWRGDRLEQAAIVHCVDTMVNDSRCVRVSIDSNIVY